MPNENTLLGLINSYKNNNDDMDLYKILDLIAGNLNYLNIQLSQINGINPNDKLLADMHAEITKLNKFKTNITDAIQGLYEAVSDFKPIHGIKCEPFSTLESIKDWVNKVKDGKIKIERRR